MRGGSYFRCINCSADVDTEDESTEPDAHGIPCLIDGSINHSTCQCGELAASNSGLLDG